MNKILFAINGLFSFFVTITMEICSYVNKHYYKFAIAFALSAISILNAKS